MGMIIDSITGPTPPRHHLRECSHFHNLLIGCDHKIGYNFRALFRQHPITSSVAQNKYVKIFQHTHHCSKKIQDFIYGRGVRMDKQNAKITKTITYHATLANQLSSVCACVLMHARVCVTHEMSLLMCIMYAYVTWQHHCYYYYNDNNINSAIIIPGCATVYLWYTPALGLWCWSKVGYRVTMGCDKGPGRSWMDLGPNSSIKITHIEHTRNRLCIFT